MKLTKTNPRLVELIRNLRKLARQHNVKLWKRISDELSRSSRQWREVNILRLARVTKDGETVIVPGKVLGSGDIKHKLNVAAFGFSESAKKKINAMTIEELMKKNPKAKDVRIIG